MVPRPGLLKRVVHVGAVIGGVDLAVAVDVVELAGIADAVVVAVQLGGVGDVDAVVAEVSDSVTVGVRLGRVIDQGAHVRRRRHAIAVQIGERALVRHTVPVAIAAGIDVVDDERSVRRWIGEHVARRVGRAGECDRAAEQSRAPLHRRERVPLGVRLQDREPVGRELYRVAVGHDHDLDARPRCTRRIAARQLRVVDRDLHRLLALVQVRAVRGDGGALPAGRVARRIKPRAGGRVTQGRLVGGMDLVPLEYQVVYTPAVIRVGRAGLDAVEAESDRPAIPRRTRDVEHGVLRGREAAQVFRDDAALESDQGSVEVAHRTVRGQEGALQRAGAAGAAIGVGLARTARGRAAGADARYSRSRKRELQVIGI